MQASFWAAVDARDALIDGDLAKAQHAGAALAKTDFGSLPQDWKPWVTQLQVSAIELSVAPSLAAGAQQLGHVALICGDCHYQHEFGPTAQRAKPSSWEEPQEPFEARMQSHQLGVAQMWDGLVRPSEPAWRDGTNTITRAPLTAAKSEAQPIDQATQERIVAVRALAREARIVTTYDERARIYGELIARCADCHAHGPQR